MSYLKEIEEKVGAALPDIYKDFYMLCSTSIPQGLVGTDLLNQSPDLDTWAKDLLTENGAENFLDNDDIVFMMHQGYVFWFFKANGNQDPMVYGYREGNTSPDRLEPLSKFIDKIKEDGA
jgi:hypothetical protein